MLIFINSSEILLLTAQILTVLFIAILFLQSGFDKIINKKENLGWLTSHFSNSPFKNSVPFLFTIITVIEILSGILSLIGIVFLILERNSILAIFGVLFASLALIALFLGQRIAKDYQGAQSLVSYFILSILTLLLLVYNM